MDSTRIYGAVEPAESLADIPSVEVAPTSSEKAKRRKFTAKFKLKVLHETDQMPEGQVGAYLRKNGLYSSYLSAWRVQREEGALAQLESKGRGRKNGDASARELAETRRELLKAQEQLRQANAILEIQKKVLLLCESLPEMKSRR